MLIAALALIFYTGGAPTEIAEKTIVSAIGIDCDSGKVKVTMQVFRPEGSGSDTAVDPSAPNIGILKGEGKTVGEAIEECRSKLGGEMYIGKNRIIIFGRNADLSSADKLLDGLINDPECYYKQSCAAAEETAEKLLEIPVSGGAVASERYLQMIDSAKKAGMCSDTTLDEVYTSMKYGSKCITMPVFGKCSDMEQQDQSSEEQNKDSLSAVSDIRLKECAVYKDGRFCRNISCEDMGIVAAVEGRNKTVTCDGSSWKILSHTIKPVIRNGVPAFELRLKLFKNEELEDKDDREAKEKLKEKAEKLIAELNEDISPAVTGTDMLMKKYYPQKCSADKHLTNPAVWYIIVV